MLEDSPPTLEELLAQAQAEELLAKLDVLEDLAELHDSEQVALIRQTLARQYREAMGIFPEERQRLRDKLGQIIDGERVSAAKVIGGSDVTN